MTKSLITETEINEIFKRLSSLKSQPKVELNYNCAYTLMISVILSAQATDKSVNKVTDKLYRYASTPEAIIQLGIERLTNEIRSIGLYNNKARNIISTSEKLLKLYDGKVPQDFNQLIELPGIGRKSAKVILNSIYNKKVIAVDTHVFRTANRIGICNEISILKTEKVLEERISDQWKLYAHHWLVLHGRYICKARKPECNKCPLNDICLYYQNHIK